MNNYLFFTIGKAQDSNAESNGFKKYIGVGTAKVLAVNPTKAQLKELAGYEPQEEPVYTGVQEIEGKSVPFARIVFLMKVTPEGNNGAEFTHQLNFFVRNQYRKGATTGKFQVVDGYANFVWGDEATIKENGTIMYSNGPAKLIGAYQPVFVGYPAVLSFIKEYLSIGSVGDTNGFDYINGSWTPKTGEALEACAISFTKEEIQAWFRGDVSSIRSAIELMPNNEVKAVFGISINNENGKERQDMYPRVIRKKSDKVDIISKEIEEARNRGGLSNRIYEYTPIHEYVVTPTDLTAAPVAEDPFANATIADNPWA